MFLLRTQRVNERGRLEIGGCDAVDLAAHHGTPLYVFDEAAIRERCRAYRQAFGARYPHVRIEYAGKAFLCLAMARLVHEEGLHLDVASAGELYTALRAGFPPPGLVFHGNNKSAAELALALDAGVGRIVIDNLHEVDLLAPLVARRPRPQEVLVRVAPGVDPHTHRKIQTGQAARHLPLPVLQVEPGRSIVGEAGTTLYTVGAIKEVPIPEPPGTRTYVAVDGGMSDNPRPQLYDAVYSALIANKAGRPADTPVRIAGKHCETDVLIQSTTIQHPEPGDVLAVLSTGAYTYSMASNYNRLPRPAAVFVRDGRARLVIRRETLDDLLRQDVG